MAKATRDSVRLEYKAVPILGGAPAIGEDRVVRSLFAVCGNVDAVGDRILSGAFRKTLAEHRDKIQVLWQHDATQPPVGVPVALDEIGQLDLPGEVRAAYPEAVGGLMGSIKYLPTPRGDEILTGLRAGAIRFNSIGYDPIASHTQMDAEGVRNLGELRVWDVSPVNWPANSAAIVVKSAIPYKDCGMAPEDADWDGPAEMAAADVEDLRIMCAWYDAENADQKSAYKLPHHMAAGQHVAVWRAVAAAMAALMGGRGGVDIPEGDRRAVYNHLAKHYAEFDREPPDFKLFELAAVCKDALRPGAFKEGRVLSKRNLDRLLAALKEIQDVIAAAEPPEASAPKALTAALARVQIAEREMHLLNLFN